jgi:hypothetical protein
VGIVTNNETGIIFNKSKKNDFESFSNFKNTTRILSKSEGVSLIEFEI